jgi:hypothetical protein
MRIPVIKHAKRSANRRAFLRALGLGATALPFYRLLEDSFAQAAGETLPLKLMVLSHPHGFAREYWGMRHVEADDIAVDGLPMRGADTEKDFDISYLNCSLQPFDDQDEYGKSYKDRLLLIEGLDLAADGHDATSSILTGSPITNGLPSNSSLDQFLAVEAGLGAQTRKSNVVLCVGDADIHPASTLSYSTGGTGVGKIISPFEAFDYLFGGFVPSDEPAAQAALLRRNQLGQSVVDFVRDDCNRLRERLSPLEQQKMDQHLAAIRDLEKSFSASMANGTCMLPSRPANTLFPTETARFQAFNGGEPTYDAVTTSFLDMMAQAFACDITRFGTMVMNDLPWDSPNAATVDSLGYGLPADLHTLVAHTYASRSYDWENKLRGKGDPRTWLPLATYNKYIYGKVARFVQKLDELGTFESTLVYVTSEMGNPSFHSSSGVPTVLVGGSNVPFTFGRRLRVTPDCLPPNDSCKARDAAFAVGANNHLLVSIAQAFGVEVDSFGQGLDNTFTEGGLSSLT